MRITCLWKLVNTERYAKIIKNYIPTCYPNHYQWRFNDKRLIWHVKHNDSLSEWAREKGVKI